jgi:hypothetical protein
MKKLSEKAAFFKYCLKQLGKLEESATKLLANLPNLRYKISL